MKKAKILLPLLLIFCATSCSKEEIAIVTSFSNQKLQSLKSMSAEEKAEIKSQVYNYGLKAYVYASSYDETTTTKEKFDSIRDYFSLFETDYFSYDEQKLIFSTQGTRGSVKKDGDRYIQEGSYFSAFEKIYGTSAGEAERMFNFANDEKIFSFGITDLIRSASSKSNTSYGNNLSVSSSISSGWYLNLSVKEDDGNGNFVVYLTKPVSVSMKMNVDAQGMSITVDSTIKFDFFEIEYKNNLLSNSIYSANIKASYQGYEVSSEKWYYNNDYFYNTTPESLGL